MGKPYPNVDFNCETCGKRVVRYQPPHRGAARFCSPSCMGASGAGIPKAPEHRAKIGRFGTEHHAWKGDAVSVRAGRSRALRRYPVTPPCQVCQSPKSERHHIDENTANNEPENIAFLCRRCHMAQDGRLQAFAANAPINQPRAVAIRWVKCPTFRKETK